MKRGYIILWLFIVPILIFAEDTKTIKTGFGNFKIPESWVAGYAVIVDNDIKEEPVSRYFDDTGRPYSLRSTFWHKSKMSLSVIRLDSKDNTDVTIDEGKTFVFWRFVGNDIIDKKIEWKPTGIKDEWTAAENYISPAVENGQWIKEKYCRCFYLRKVGKSIHVLCFNTGKWKPVDIETQKLIDLIYKSWHTK